MLPLSRQTYAKNEATTWSIPNYWDILALLLVLGLVILLGWGASNMAGRYVLGQTLPISLTPWYLPYYALRTVLRMLIALCCSLVFTFIFGTWAAKNRHAERLIIPAIDILQSVPVLGFLSVAVATFIGLLQGNLLAPECAAIFAIFTAQVWNMTLSFYQSVSSVPKELREAAAMFQLSAWQRFWRLEVPFAMPGLLWNAMLSMSGSWIFLVAAEAIAVGPYQISLPGIGSYIALAIAQQNLWAIGYVIVAMLVVIALYDQLLFRPLIAWAEKFKLESSTTETIPTSWVLDLFQRTRWFRYGGQLLGYLADIFVNNHWCRRSVKSRPKPQQSNRWWRYILLVLYGVLFLVWLALIHRGYQFVFATVPFYESLHVLYLGLITALRVLLLISLSAVIWVPAGIGIGLNPRLAGWVRPIAQFLAAFPANLLYPLVVMLILRYQLNVNIWTSPLMILGTQWYILFNVIAGAQALPKSLHQAVSTLNVRGWLWWRRFILPGIFPYLITGAITAAGGAWNVSIIAEAVSWGSVHLYATGAGAYIAQATAVGDYPRVVLGIVVMACYVLVINRLLWRPLYRLAVERYQI